MEGAAGEPRARREAHGLEKVAHHGLGEVALVADGFEVDLLGWLDLLLVLGITHRF